MDLDGPFKSLAFFSPSFAASAIPAACCCAFDCAGMISSLSGVLTSSIIYSRPEAGLENFSATANLTRVIGRRINEQVLLDMDPPEKQVPASFGDRRTIHRSTRTPSSSISECREWTDTKWHDALAANHGDELFFSCSDGVGAG